MLPIARLSRWLVALSLIALVLAACGTDAEEPAPEAGDEPGATEETEEPEPTDEGEEPDEAEPTEEAETTEEPQELTELSVAHLPIAAKVQVIIAEGEGVFAEEGIDPTFEVFAGDAEAMPAMVAGEVDGGGINIATMISSVAEGIDIGCFSGGQVIPQEGPDTGNILVAADSDIDSLADLEGRTLAVNNIGSLMWTFAQALFTQEGVDPSTVDFVELPFPNMGDALTAGQVDAIANVEPFNTVLTGQGLAEVLSPLYIPVLPGVELDCLVFPMDFYRENEEVVHGFIRAYERGKEMAMENEELLISYTVEDTGMDRELVEQIVLPEWQTGVDEERLQDFADLMYEFEVIPERVDVSEFVHEGVAD